MYIYIGAHIWYICINIYPNYGSLNAEGFGGVGSAELVAVGAIPEGPSSQYLRSLVPKTIPLMVFGTKVLKNCALGLCTFNGFGTRSLKYWVLGSSGYDLNSLQADYTGW